ncbi:MAG: SpoIIE family protein phosphatase [Clostridiales bacterium]|nr:SpoIIE family protein phosphatase [Clostridiales bacterium]
MHLRINLKNILLYAAYALFSVMLNAALPTVPFSLGLCFSMLVCGANIIATPLIYIAASVINLDWITVVLSVFEGGFLTAITFLYRRTGRKIRFEAALYIVIALAPYLAFARWHGIDSLYFTSNPYILKTAAAVAVAVFAFFAFRSVYALMFRLCRCRLRPDELICISAFFAVAGVGLNNLTGLHAYVCIGAGLTAFAVRLLKSPSAVIAACVIALPCAVTQLNFDFLTAFVLISVAALAFSELGKFAICSVSLICSAGALYVWGAFTNGVATAVICGILLGLCCILPLFPTEKSVKGLRSLLTIEKVLPRTGEEQYRELVSEKLYRMSEVFREIENAFCELDEKIDDAAMKRRMIAECKQSMCANCKRQKTCEATKVYRGFASLIEAGCLKGKVSFVDLNGDVTANCNNPTALTETVNRLLYEYRKTNLEAENARQGRRLLAGQARGVAEVLKNRAVEFCRESEDFSEYEKKIVQALAANGVSCPEIRVRGREKITVNLTLVDCKNFSAVKKTVEKITGVKLLLKDKTVYDNQKVAYMLVEPPKYDAAFGVACAVKDGERVSGDTHTVIKINEHSFLMALSDGMGSGEYARKVSTTAISLIEAFYRAEMPTDIVLDTINKLLCFNRDERFTCIDVAAIDLNTLTASLIKVGSPVGLIVRKGEIKVLESRSLPLGILDNLHPATAKEQLRKDDIVVFMSDGVTSAFNGVSDLYDYLQTLKPLNPQNLADKILTAARQRVLGTPDDMTVLCVRIFAKQ